MHIKLNPSLSLYHNYKMVLKQSKYLNDQISELVCFLLLLRSSLVTPFFCDCPLDDSRSRVEYRSNNVVIDLYQEKGDVTVANVINFYSI